MVPGLASSPGRWAHADRGDGRHVARSATDRVLGDEAGNAVLENLARLRLKGFGLSIDDYGTGYSSMQQLTRIAFTELKIDQSFVMNATKQESSRVILESSIDMAKKLKLVSVAEGIETQTDWNLLHQLGCNLAQGYFIAEPMETSVFLSWARNWKQSGLVTQSEGKS